MNNESKLSRKQQIASHFGTGEVNDEVVTEPETDSVESSLTAVSMSNTKDEILAALAEAGMESVDSSLTKSELLDLF